MRVTDTVGDMDGQMYPISKSDCDTGTITIPNRNIGAFLDDCNDY